MPCTTTKAFQAAQAQKAVPRTKASSLVFDVFSEESEWKLLTTSDKRSKKELNVKKSN